MGELTKRWLTVNFVHNILNLSDANLSFNLQTQQKWTRHQVIVMFVKKKRFSLIHHHFGTDVSGAV